MNALRRFIDVKETLAGPASRRAAYFSLSQAAFACLAGSFEMPMAFRLAGRIDLVALVYAFFYTTLFCGFLLGMLLLRDGAASRVYRLALSLLSFLCFGVVLLFPLMKGLPALACYFLIRGLAEGLYWSARHRAFLWSVRDSGRDGFALKLQSLVVSLSVVLPLAGGFAITYFGSLLGRGAVAGGLPAGYLPVFLLSGLVTLAALACSPSFAIGRSPVSLLASIGIFRLEGALSWRVYLALVSFAGALVTVAAGVQTFGVLKTEFRIGALNAGIALLSGTSFFVLGRVLAGRKGARLGGVFVGALADFGSRAAYALAPTAGGLAVKSLLDALAVPLKSLLGENVQFALIERLSRGVSSATSAPGTTRAPSAGELYLFREFLIWLVRIAACATTALALVLVSRSAAPGVDAPKLAGRILLAAAAPVSLAEILFLRSFVRAVGH